MTSTEMRRDSEMVRVRAETSDLAGRVTKREHDMTPYKVDKLIVNVGNFMYLLLCTFSVNLAKPLG